MFVVLAINAILNIAWSGIFFKLRRPDWALHALDGRQNEAIARVTPRENPAVNGPWICN